MKAVHIYITSNNSFGLLCAY